MLKRSIDLPFSSDTDKQWVKFTANVLKRDWESIEQLVIWEYGTKHLKQQNQNLFHCCSHALGETCIQVHNTESFKQCASCFEYFVIYVRAYLSELKRKPFENDECSSKLKSMINAIPIMAISVQHYMAHRLRAKIQFDAINKIKTILKEDPRSILIVMVHK